MSNLRLVDTTIHELTSPQTLEQLLRLFRQSTSEPVTLTTARGEGKGLINRVRTELARSRKDYQAQGRPAVLFGFKVEGPIYVHSDGIAKECHVISYRITPLQQIKNLSQFTELE